MRRRALYGQVSYLDYLKQTSILFLDAKTLNSGAVSSWPSSSTNYAYTANKVDATGPTKGTNLVFDGTNYMKITALDLTILAEYSVYIVHTLKPKIVSGTGTMTLIDHKLGTSNGSFRFNNPLTATYLYFNAQNTGFGGFISTTADGALTNTDVLLFGNIANNATRFASSVNGSTAVTFVNGNNWVQPTANDFFIGANFAGGNKYTGNINCVLILPIETPTQAVLTNAYLKSYYGIA